MRAVTLLVVGLAAIGSVAADEAAVDADAQKQRILEETQVVAVMTDGTLGDFRDDGDPQTLQIVFLTKKADGPSRVSEDGEVIFLYKASDQLQSDLIGEAFERRIARRLGGS